VAQFAVRAIPGAEGAGLTLLEENRSGTMVATAEFVPKSTTFSTASARAPASVPRPISRL
jgi:hypothetical protein